jgi:hypothetical protein
MGRLTKGSKRTRIQDYMKKMRDTFRAALKDDDLQKAFDELWSTWSSEMAAMIYADIIPVTDLILLTSVVDNRREIEKLKNNPS